MESREYSTSLGTTSTNLLERVREHDQQAWQRLIRLYSPLICYWFRSANLKVEDRRDLLQEIWRAVVEHLDGFKKDRPGATFRGWLRTVARNKLIDHLRRNHREPAGRGGSTALEWLHQLPDGEAALVEGESSEPTLLLRRALRMIQLDFTPSTWQVFLRTVIEGHETRDVADELGMTTVAVRQARARVLKRLRSEFGSLLD